jgi:hypothetical protein
MRRRQEIHIGPRFLRLYRLLSEQRRTRKAPRLARWFKREEFPKEVFLANFGF